MIYLFFPFLGLFALKNFFHSVVNVVNIKCMDNCFQSLHRKEKDLLLSIIKAKSISRTTLQKESDLKVANFYNTVDSLLSHGLIEKTEDTQHQSKGRPSEFLSLNPDAYNTLYILLSRSKCHLAVSNLVGDLYEEEEYPVSFSITVDDFISSVKEYYLKKKDNLLTKNL